jgi:hypothetical protein
MGSLFFLAERGIVAIREAPRGMAGQRHFTIERAQRHQALAPHEEAILEVVFAGESAPEAQVTVSKARSRLTRHWSNVKRAIRRELAEAHLFEPSRQASRHRFMVAGFTLLGLAGAAAPLCLLLLEENGAWPLLMPLALAIVAVASFIVQGSLTPLSNDGVRRGEAWRAYRKHLSDPQAVEARWGAGGSGEARLLPMAVALGLAAAWAKFLKKRHAHVPAWFHAASHDESGAAFAVLIASAGASAHGGGAPGGGASGGAAGGGASGAG